MAMAKEDRVRRVTFQQLKKKYRYATGGSGRRFFLGFARHQLRSQGRRGTNKKVKAPTKRGARWMVTSTSQATDSSPKDDYVMEEEDASQGESEESLEQEESLLGNHKVEDPPYDQLLWPASATGNGAAQIFPSGSQNPIQNDSRTAALPSLLCPLEPTQFFISLQSKGLQFLKDIEVHISTSSYPHSPLKDLVFGEPLNGTTPLLLASHCGDVDCVKHIVEHWGVDVNSAGVYYFDPLHPRYCVRLSKATPLFVAARVGHIGIARFLVGEGADVSFKTSEGFTQYDGYTPLHAAAYILSGNGADPSTMIRFLLESEADPNAHPTFLSHAPLWMTESVASLTSLLDHGLNLDQRNFYDETALHYWINLESASSDPNRKRDAFTVIKLLVNKGADVTAQDKHGFTVILAAANSQNWNAMDYLLETDGGDRMEKIEAMELAAAIMLSKSHKASEFGQAFRYWRRAYYLRQIEPEMQKTPLALKSGQAGEWVTSDQLEHVIEHPLEYKIQAFLVRLRICSSKSWGAVLAFLNDSFDGCLEDLKAQGRLADVIDVLWAMWKAIHLYESESDDVFWKANYIVENLIWTLSELGMDDPLFNGETLMLPLEVMIAANELTFYENDFDSYDSYNNNADHYMNTSFQIIAFFAGLPYEFLTSDIRLSLRQLVLQNTLGENGRTLLHMTCEYFEVDHLSTIRLLILSGADPNASDENGNLPLHVLANQHGNDSAIQSAAHLLLECGAQPERANDFGETPADVWIRCHEPQAGLNDLPAWCLKPVTVPNLKSFCARIIRSQGVPYDEQELPATVISLVELRELGG